MLENKRKYLLLILTFSLCTNFVLAQEKISFDKYQWMKDTLGQKGYKIRVDGNDLYLLLLGKNKKQVAHILGKPDFISKQKKGKFSYNYCIEGGKYCEKPCGENNCSKSFISIYFINGLVEDIITVWVGG
jgi:hypothetical protein